jgi:hypothetical protein
MGYCGNVSCWQHFSDLVRRNIPDISRRGYQMFQHVQNPGGPNEFDRDVTKDDALGGAVVWLTKNAVLVA